ncbi:MAG: hypothetical protein MUE51_10890 [Thermoleophilia bacterium]|jgi:cbb3-type cytochrome oxidase subunit 3|nr:hypothetical protein [Thermoleophilia bacterium]
MTTPSGLFFSYLLGAIFTVGGILFLAFLEENRLLYGLPYLAIGLLLIGGVWSAQRRKRRHDAEEAARAADEADGPPQVA